MSTTLRSRRHAGEQTLVPGAAAATLIAYVLVTVGSCLRGDVLFILGVPLTAAGFGAAWMAATGRRWTRGGWSASMTATSLSALAAVGLVAPPIRAAAWWYDAAARVYFGAAIVLVGVFAGGGAVGRRRTTYVLVAGAVALQVAVPIGIAPVSDVWSWTETCTRALLHGVHPYTIHAAADLQRGAFDYGSTPTIYPYMPLTLVAAAPWVALLGDYRFGLACCLPATIVMIRAAGRRLAVDERTIDLVTIALALHPLAPAITAVGYVEPLLVAVSAAFLLSASIAPGGYSEAVSFWLLAALKQYVAAPMLLYAAMRGRPRTVAAGAAIAAATAAPFLVWNPRATVDGMLFFMRAPLGFRFDSDSLAAMAAAATGAEAPRALAVAVQFAAAGLIWPVVRNRGLAGFLLACALALMASFLAATQAFPNYYYAGGALLLWSALAAARQEAAA